MVSKTSKKNKMENMDMLEGVFDYLIDEVNIEVSS